MNGLQALVLVSLAVGAPPSQEATPPTTTSRPNLAIHVSGSLINVFTQRPVQRIQPVEEEILGTMYNGISNTCGQVRAELVPSPSQAALDLVMTGATYAESYGYKNTFQVHTRTTIPFEVRKRIAIDSRQICLPPASAAAVAESEILGLANLQGEEHKLSVFFARCRAYQDKPMAELITADRTRKRLSTEFDEEVYPQLAERHDDLAAALDQARELGLLPRPFEWSTSTEQIHLKITVPTPGQPLPSSPRPAPRSADLAIDLHESLVNEFAQKTLAGQTFTFDQLADVMRNVFPIFLGNEELYDKITDLKKLTRPIHTPGPNPLLISFPQRRPMTVTFGDQGFTIFSHGVRFKEGKTTYPALDSKVSYRIEKTTSGLAAVRKGPVEVFAPPGSGTVPDVLLLSRVALSYNLLFLERVTITGIPLSTFSSTQGGNLAPVQAEAEAGWLTFSWVRQGK